VILCKHSRLQAGLQDGDQLTGKLKLASTEDACALRFCGGDGVVTQDLVVTAL